MRYRITALAAALMITGACASPAAPDAADNPDAAPFMDGGPTDTTARGGGPSIGGG